LYDLLIHKEFLKRFSEDLVIAETTDCFGYKSNLIKAFPHFLRLT